MGVFGGFFHRETVCLRENKGVIRAVRVWVLSPRICGAVS